MAAATVPLHHKPAQFVLTQITLWQQLDECSWKVNLAQGKIYKQKTRKWLRNKEDNKPNQDGDNEQWKRAQYKDNGLLMEGFHV